MQVLKCSFFILDGQGMRMTLAPPYYTIPDVNAMQSYPFHNKTLHYEQMVRILQIYLFYITRRLSIICNPRDRGKNNEIPRVTFNEILSYRRKKIKILSNVK